jgi:hypothetical protein
MASVTGTGEVMVMPRVKRRLPVFGSLWYVALSRVMTIGP